MTNPSASNPRNFKRRQFLLTAGLGMGSAAVAGLGADRLVIDPPAAATVGRPSTGQGYQATEHVRNYYRTARI